MSRNLNSKVSKNLKKCLGNADSEIPTTKTTNNEKAALKNRLSFKSLVVVW